MRYAIFSDVHANLEALEALLETYATRGIDRYVCLGDTVGYGASPEACCDRVRAVADVTVLGNHDAAVAGRMDYSYYYDQARETLDLHASLLGEANREWLRGLPYLHRDPGAGITFCHGSPLAPEEFEYVFTVEQARALVPHFDTLSPITFLGHSHLTRCFAITARGALEVAESAFVCDPDRRYFITVGSVGQPRDFDARACGGIYDTETRRFEFLRVPYAIDVAALKVFDQNQAVTFGKRLFLGI